MCRCAFYAPLLHQREAKGGETRNWFFFAASSWNRSFTPTTSELNVPTANTNSQKGPSQNSSCNLWCYGAGHGWLQNIFLFLHVRIQFRNEFKLFMLLSFGHLHHKRRKDGAWKKETNEFYAEMRLAKKDSWRNVLDLMTKENEKRFSAREIRSHFHLSVTVKKEIWREMKISSWLVKSTRVD